MSVANSQKKLSRGEVQKQLDEYKSKCKDDAEKLVTEVFPLKVLNLNSMLESDKFTTSRVTKLESKLNIPIPAPVTANHDSGDAQDMSKKRKLEEMMSVPGSKVVVLPNGAVNTNLEILELINMVKPEIRELIDNANKVKMWITYLIPRIEDGNNFGVSIQEDTMAEARQVESEAATYLDQISRYFMTRAKVISKVAKYPHVEDYRLTVKELDEKEFVSLRLVICELRNHYASLHDIIIKNLDKIKKPRNSNTDNMY